MKRISRPGRALIRRAALLLVLMLTCSTASAAPSAEYLSGFVAGYLRHLAGAPAIEVASVEDDGTVVLVSTECVPDAVKARATEDLITNGPATALDWRTAGDCPEASQTAAADETAGEAEVIAEPLPLTELFNPPIADPRAARSSLRYERYDAPRGSFNAGAISAGDSFPLTTFNYAEGDRLQLALEGAIFSIFDLDADSSDLVNTDFVIGVPITYRRGNAALRFRPYHQSSHLGDEFLLGNPEITRINLSYEDLELLGAYDLGPLRVYGGGSAIVRSEPELDPFRLQGGLELRIPDVIGRAAFIVAADIQSRQELSWRADQSYIAGLAFTRREDVGERELRLVGEYFDGSSPNGQFFEEQVRYVGFGLQLEL